MQKVQALFAKINVKINVLPAMWWHITVYLSGYVSKDSEIQFEKSGKRFDFFYPENR